MLVALATILAAYLIGAVPFALIVARLNGIPDIRTVGSGNVGATNVLRLLGPRVAVWVFVLDLAKGVLPVLAARWIAAGVIPLNHDVFLSLVAVASILGHVFPVYIGFRGGKGVLTALGALLVLMPLPVTACVAVFLVVTVLFRYISLGSILAALCLPIFLVLHQFALGHTVPATNWVLGALIAVLVPMTHLQNIRRLLTGTENRFSLGSAGSRGGTHG